MRGVCSLGRGIHALNASKFICLVTNVFLTDFMPLSESFCMSKDVLVGLVD